MPLFKGGEFTRNWLVSIYVLGRNQWGNQWGVIKTGEVCTGGCESENEKIFDMKFPLGALLPI